ncbi:Sec23/Sec24 trunk domain-containing protein [Aphelenchoides avenae]|nr:Sec23/Sec24 trunk domain-containing protein [Aphelenchus avenae]
MIGFIGVDATLHFFQFINADKPPRHLVGDDLPPFAPVHGGLVVQLKDFKESVSGFVQTLPTLFESTSSPQNCMGAALDLAHNLIVEIGGRITVVTTRRPDVGPRSLNNRDSASSSAMMPATDFYKRLALECTSRQISIDFVLSNNNVDLASLGAYLTRKVGFEAVLRIRCTRGLSLYNFHGNFFVRSTDLLAMANVHPDSALAAQVLLEENLTGQQTMCFRAALIYTSSKGKRRRIRVHKMSLPVTNDFSSVFHYFGLKATTPLLSKMAAGVELSDCRKALVNAAVDALGCYNRSVVQRSGAILAPLAGHLKFMALFVLGLLKHRCTIFSIGEDGVMQKHFTRRLVEDRAESIHSYIEFLQHFRAEIQR